MGSCSTKVLPVDLPVAVGHGVVQAIIKIALLRVYPTKEVLCECLYFKLQRLQCNVFNSAWLKVWQFFNLSLACHKKSKIEVWD